MAHDSEVLPLDIARDVLQEGDAKILPNLDDTYAHLVGDAELTRGWVEGASSKIPLLVDALDTFTSMANLDTGPSRFVDNPTASGEIYPGRWRQAFVRILKQAGTGGRPDKYIIAQTLRRGYIEKLINEDSTDLDWTEARLDNKRSLPGDSSPTNAEEKYIIVRWPNVSPDVVEAIKATIQALDATTFHPIIRKEDMGTGFTRLWCTSSIEDDGSATVSLLLAQPRFQVTGFDSVGSEREADITYLWNVPKVIAQGVIDAERATGKSLTASYNNELGVVDIVVRTKDFTGITALGDVSRRNCNADETRDYRWGVSLAVAEATDIGVVPDGSTVAKEIRANGDGSYDVIITTRTVNFRNIPAFLSEAAINHSITEEKKLNLTTQSPGIISSPIGQIQTQRRIDKDDCSKDIIVRKRTSKQHGVNAHRSKDAAGGFEEITITRNRHTGPTARIAIVGRIETIGTRKNDDGTHDTVERSVIPKDQSFGPYFYHHDRNSSSTREVFDNLAKTAPGGEDQEPTLDEDQFGRLTYHFNEAGNIDGERIITKYSDLEDDGMGGFAIFPEQAGAFFEVKKAVRKNGDRVWKLVKKGWRLSYHLTKAAAYQSDTVSDRGIGGGLPGSRVTRITKGLYEAFKMTFILEEEFWRQGPIIVGIDAVQDIDPGPEDIFISPL